MKDVLTISERLVYDYIAALEEKYQIANPAVKQICDATGLSERSAHYALRKLEADNIIGVDHKTSVRRKGDSAPQRWTRPMNLRDKINGHLSVFAPSIILATTPVVDTNQWGDPVDHYWKYMDYIEQNTDRIKHRPKAKPAPVATQQPIDFDAWPW